MTGTVRTLLRALAPLLLLPLLTAGAAGAPAAPTASAASSAADVPVVRPLPVDTHVDYQLGGAREVPAGVGIVVRDRSEEPLAGRYGVCYVNAFQTQPDETAFWRARPSLVLRKGGKPVVDSAWGEWLLDVRTPAKRLALAAIVEGWTQKCAADGYDAVEFDNLDSYTRSGGLIRGREMAAYARRIVAGAHASGLAVGQKNLASWDGRVVGFDFAVAEECGRYRECHDYVVHYGRQVLSIEYRRADYRWTCARYGSRLPVVLRDRALTPGGVHAWC